MNNSSIHLQREILQMLAEHRVKVVTFPPHTSPIFQRVDVRLFGSFEKQMQDRVSWDSDETTAGFIKRISDMMKQTLVKENVRSAFTGFDLQ
jgi:hypothetical protein